MLPCCKIELLSLDKNSCCYSCQRFCNTNENSGSFFLVSPVIDPLASFMCLLTLFSTGLFMVFYDKKEFSPLRDYGDINAMTTRLVGPHDEVMTSHDVTIA